MTNGIALGVAAGAVLAFAALIFGFGGFLLTALFMAVGALIGGIATGSIDIRSAIAAARGGRRVG